MSDKKSDLDLESFDAADAVATDPPQDADSTAAPPATVTDNNAPPAMEADDRKSAADLAPVFDVPVRISAVLGKTRIDVNELLSLKRGSVLELDRKVGEAIDIYVNNRIVARGEVVIVDDQLGVTMTEIIKEGGSGTGFGSS